MFFKDDKKQKGVVSIIVKKMKGGDTYENMKSYNEGVNGASENNDYGPGYESAASEMMSAVEAKDVKAFKNALFSFVEMALCELEEKED